MRSKTILAVGATLALAATAMGQVNYAFPSPWNPAGRSASEMTQLIMFSWDDNAYSGARGTEYEWRASPTSPITANFVGGEMPSWIAGTANAGRLEGFTGGTFQNTMGLAWAYRALARGEAITAGGAQGSGIPMVFNMITGLFVDRESGTWNNAQSVLGAFRPSAQESSAHQRIAVTWGREFNSNSGGAFNTNQISAAVRRLVAAGSEIGNHTIDHMESNSPLVGPSAQFQGMSENNRTISAGGRTWQLGFANWDNEGFSTANDNVMNWGVSIRESTEFGQAVGHTAQSRGWLIFAGRQISQDAWYQYIRFSELFLLYGGVGWSSPQVPRAQLQGFRAPRLEVNSNLFYALKRAGYTYDMGLEEGYEWHRTGHNFLWPYTFDNGVQNSWTQFSSGNRVFVDSTPDGLWQLHVSPVIVPANIRSDVWSNHAAIMAGSGTPTTASDRDHWLQHGKVTGFDFNTWILYGMTGANWQATMRHTLDLRMSGNRAPMQFGLHTDYYTPIYDFATLLNDFNRPGWGQPVVQGWNTWTVRQRETEDFVNHALGRQAHFVTGIQLIDSMRTWVALGEARAQHILPASALPNEWTWVSNQPNDANNTTSRALNNLSGDIRIQSTFAPDQPRFVINFPAGTLNSATHIQLDYKQTSASMIRLITEDGRAREVMLAHRFPIQSNHENPGIDNGNFGRAELRNSGMIPISAFDYPPEVDHPMDYASVNVSQVIAIEIQPLAPYARPIAFGQPGWSNVVRTDPWEARFEFRNFRIHTGQPFDFGGVDPIDPVSIGRANRNVARALSIAGITGNALNLNIAQAGTYNVGIYTVSGRQIQSFRGQNLSAGMNTLNLNNLARGVHVVRIQGVNNNQQLVRQVIVR
ncbi:MAG: hypothetical protein FWE23_04275 [Chitinivibrionia bacterium]|nr:hypothetical protein [Chitinivibrionia bacterium]